MLQLTSVLHLDGSQKQINVSIYFEGREQVDKKRDALDLKNEV